MKKKEWDILSSKEEYTYEIYSPFDFKSTKEQLFNTIKLYSNKGRVIDLGCGIGNLIPFLVENYKEIYAIDFSPKMIEYCINKFKNKNLRFLVKDLRDLEGLKDFNLAIAINSILGPSIKDINKSFKEIYKILKRNGIFIGVFPSMDNVLYQAMLVYEKEFNKNKNKALERTKKITESKYYNFLIGTINYGGKQKFYYNFELEYRLRKAGFKTIEIKKLEYPWKSLMDKRINFPKEDKPWDWLVIARK